MRMPAGDRRRWAVNLGGKTMAGKSLWDRALDSLTTRDELAAADQAKRVAQDALARAEAEKAARQAAEERATAAEKKLAEAIGKAADPAAVSKMNNELNSLRNEVAILRGELARVNAAKDNEVADLNAVIEDLKSKAVAVESTYTIKRGDSLSKIAKEVYGDWKHWKEIYESNKDVIGANPDLVKVGQVLKLPKIG
jgi:nucleoid-associated protein YgaU